MSEHTPGPWHTSLGSVRTTGLNEQGQHTLICSLHGRTYNDANARLIAAAPQLLKALVSVLATLEYIHRNDDNIVLRAQILKTRAAIAAATGQELQS